MEARPVGMDQEEEADWHLLMTMDPVRDPYLVNFLLFLSLLLFFLWRGYEYELGFETVIMIREGAMVVPWGEGSRWDGKSGESDGKREGGSEWEERERER